MEVLGRIKSLWLLTETVCSGDRLKECEEIEIEHRHDGSKVLCVGVFLKDRMKAVSEKHLQKHYNVCIASSCLKSLDTVVCVEESSSKSISLTQYVKVIPINGPAVTLCNWLQLSPCKMIYMGRISLTLLTRQLQLKSFRDAVKTKCVLLSW